MPIDDVLRRGSSLAFHKWREVATLIMSDDADLPSPQYRESGMRPRNSTTSRFAFAMTSPASSVFIAAEMSTADNPGIISETSEALSSVPWASNAP